VLPRVLNAQVRVALDEGQAFGLWSEGFVWLTSSYAWGWKRRWSG
jgi:hypothetical protein